MRQLTYGRRVWRALQKILEFGYTPHQVFDDWLELSLAAHLSLTDNYARKGPSPRRLDGPYENRYERIISRYPEPRATDGFVTAYEELVVTVERCRMDILGAIHRFVFRGKKEDGFSTPHTLTETLAAMMGNRSGATDRIVDQRCGSGRMLIEAGRRHPRVELQGSDTDEVCAKMCALNMLIFNFRAVVKHGDATTGEYYRCWRMSDGFVAETDLRNRKKAPVAAASSGR